MSSKKISVSLTDELNDTIQSAVATGDFKSSSEVVRDALRQWHKRRQDEQLDEAYMRAAINEGLASGEGIPVSKSMFNKLRIIANGKAAKSIL